MERHNNPIANSYSLYGEKLSRRSGILELMDDLGEAVTLHPDILMLGGGNPAAIPEVQQIWRERTAELLASTADFDQMLASYDAPQGNPYFLDAFAQLFSDRFGWPITSKNVGISNGAQPGVFSLLNLLAGPNAGGTRKYVLMPLSPDYVGYADMGIDDQMFIACPGKITFVPNSGLFDDESEIRSDAEPDSGCEPLLSGGGFFKYAVDFDRVERLLAMGTVAALLVSRPTNPSGNVIRHDELVELDRLAAQYNAYLIVDNAYGTPFPAVLEEESLLDKVFYSPRTIQTFSLSKIGLPGLRTAFIVGPEEIIQRLAAMTAIIGLANGNVGQRLTLPLFQTGRILDISRQLVRPFYQKRRRLAVRLLTDALKRSGIAWRLHVSEGAFFLWLWLPDLKISAAQLYETLKQRGVLIIPGEGFFYGCDETAALDAKSGRTKSDRAERDIADSSTSEKLFAKHRSQCIRISFSAKQFALGQAFEIIAQTAAEFC